MKENYASVYDVKLDQIKALGGTGDKNKYDSVYQEELEMLRLLEEGGGGGGEGVTPAQVRAIVEGYNYTTMAAVEAKDYMNQKKLTLNGDATAIVDENGNVLTYTQIKALVDNKALFVYMLVDNAFYIPCGDMVVPSGHNAVEFSSAFIVSGEASIARIIIDTENEVIYEQYWLADKDWVNRQGFLKEHQSLAGYATENWVENKHYLTEHQSLADYALKSEIPSLDGYATENWVNGQGYLTEHQSLAGYATENWVENKHYLTEHQQLKTINNQSIIGTGNIEIGGETSGITEAECRSIVEGYDYATKGEIPSLDGYATENWVLSQKYLTEHQSLAGYATENFVTSQGYLTEHQSLAGYATENWVTSQGYLAEHQSLDNYALKSEIPSLAGYATENWVENKGYLTEHQSLAGYATENWVNEQGFLTEHQSLAGYALKSEIPSLDGYATENWVENKGYLTEHQSLAGYATENFVTSQGYLTEIPSEYAKKTDIPSVEGLASEQYVNDELAKKQNTITDLATIRSGAALGATAIQEHQSLKTINGESIVGTGNIEIQGGSGTTPEQVREIVEGYNYTTLATVESQGYLKEVPAIYAKVVMLTQAEYNALSTKDEHTLYIITDAAE